MRFICLARICHTCFKSDPAYFLPDSDKQVRTVTIFFNPSGKLAALFDLPEMKAVKAFIAQAQNGFKVPDDAYADIANRINTIQYAGSVEQLSGFIELLNVLSANTKIEHLASGSYTFSMTDPEGMRIASVYNYIMHNYNIPLTLDDVARQAHLTPTAFCRYF